MRSLRCRPSAGTARRDHQVDGLLHEARFEPLREQALLPPAGTVGVDVDGWARLNARDRDWRFLALGHGRHDRLGRLVHVGRRHRNGRQHEGRLARPRAPPSRRRHASARARSRRTWRAAPTGRRRPRTSRRPRRPPRPGRTPRPRLRRSTGSAPQRPGSPPTPSPGQRPTGLRRAASRRTEAPRDRRSARPRQTRLRRTGAQVGGSSRDWSPSASLANDAGASCSRNDSSACTGDAEDVSNAPPGFEPIADVSGSLTLSNRA